MFAIIRFLLVALLALVSLPLTLLYFALRLAGFGGKPKGPKLYTPGTKAHARLVAQIERDRAAAVARARARTAS